MSPVASTMARQGGLPSSLASSSSITSTLTASSSSQSLAPIAQGRLRSNSNTSSVSQVLSPTDARHAGPQARAQAQGPLPPPRIEHPPAADSPPPRPPRGPLRSPGAPKSPNMPTTGAGPEAIQSLLKKALEGSRDGGETLDLSRERLDHIGEEEVDFFRHKVGREERRGVWRLALSYNNLRDNCIVQSFASLHRLRYLNLKGNQLSVVPPALLDLHALEILDLSKNFISAFPENPGRLAHLKVLSLSSNRLTALPTYLVTFNNLKVFKVDHNPITWPPRHVLGPLVETERSSHSGHERDSTSRQSEEDLRPWISGMKVWLQEHLDEQTLVDDVAQIGISDGKPKDGAHVQSAGSLLLSVGNGDARSEAIMTMKRVSSIPEVAEETDQAWSTPRWKDGRAVDLSNTSTPTVTGSNSSTVLPHPPSLESLSHHDRSVSSSSTPPISASSSSSLSGQIPTTGYPPPLPPPPTQPNGHSRGASYTVTQRLSGGLTAKKSLPDLRQSHAKIIEERRGEGADKLRPLGLGIAKNSHWQGKSHRPNDTDKPQARSLQKKSSLDVLRLKEPDAMNSPNRRDNEGSPAIDESRNSYFRRVSMLPPSTISKAVSPAMLMFVDAVRGLLFALTQLHTALRQYLNFAVPDHVAGVFARVLEPATRYITTLINALDRFDSTARRSAPPVNAVRNVVDAAKESIAVFGKIVAGLRLQIPAFKNADVRYTRLLLLNIHGAMAEIACAWKTITPLLVEIRPLLTPEGTRAVAPTMVKSVSAAGLAGRTISPILERGESAERTPSRSTAAALAAPSMPPVGTSPRSKSRRHAGSFSALDVERGMMMGSPGLTPQSEWPDMSQPMYNGGMGDLIPPFPLRAEPEPPADQTPPMVTSFSQPARSRHNQTSSAGSSYLSAPTGPHRNLSFDVRPPTPASATLFDEDLLDVIETATDIAFTVWLRLAEDIGASAAPYTHNKNDSISSTSSGRLGLSLMPRDSRRPTTIPSREYHELVSALSTAEQITTTLRETLMGLRANPFAFAHSSLQDNAQAFIKIVVRVSGLIKNLSVAHTFGISVRQALSRLTQATRECAILIQVSSLRPTQSTPALVPSSASTEDLGQPYSGSGSGLRGLHLPARQALRSRNQSSHSSAANGSPPMPEITRFERR